MYVAKEISVHLGGKKERIYCYSRNKVETIKNTSNPIEPYKTTIYIIRFDINLDVFGTELRKRRCFAVNYQFSPDTFHQNFTILANYIVVRLFLIPTNENLQPNTYSCVSGSCIWEPVSLLGSACPPS